MTAVDPADIAALRAENPEDLIEYLLLLGGRPRTAPLATPALDEIAAAPISSPLHRPGAWPSGTRPAGPNTCSPDCDCALIRPETP